MEEEEEAEEEGVVEEEWVVEEEGVVVVTFLPLAQHVALWAVVMSRFLRILWLYHVFY